MTRYFVFTFSLLACTPAASTAPEPPPSAPMISAAVEPPAPPPLPPVAADPPRERPPLPNVGPCPRSAIVLVIDRSGSMSGLPIEMAKNGANATLAKLDQRDCFGLITFDSQPTRWIPIAPLKDKEAVKKRIAQITAGGGTELRGALDDAAREILAAEAAPQRGVVLLTDGQSPQTGIRDLTASLAREKVIVSTVGLGGGVDQSLLRMIATEGNGRASFVNDPLQLPSVLAGEVTRIVTP